MAVNYFEILRVESSEESKALLHERGHTYQYSPIIVRRAHHRSKSLRRYESGRVSRCNLLGRSPTFQRSGDTTCNKLQRRNWWKDMARNKERRDKVAG
jgi:hypothetical protein